MFPLRNPRVSLTSDEQKDLKILSDGSMRAMIEIERLKKDMKPDAERLQAARDVIDTTLRHLNAEPHAIGFCLNCVSEMVASRMRWQAVMDKADATPAEKRERMEQFRANLSTIETFPDAQRPGMESMLTFMVNMHSAAASLQEDAWGPRY